MTLSIEEARKILGSEYEKVPDSVIEDIFRRLRTLAYTIIDRHKRHPGQSIFGGEVKQKEEPKINKERHLANKMPTKATLGQRVKRHIEHVAHCKCRPMPESVKKEIKKRLG